MTVDDHGILIRRLELIAELDEDDKRALRDLPLQVEYIPPNTDIVREGDHVQSCCLLLDGVAYRYRHTLDGKRQIIAFHLSGDVPDLHSLHIHVMDHSMAVTDATRVAFVKHQAVWDLCRARERIAAALWLETLIDGAIFREWIVALGRRNGRSRTAHLLCEITLRMKAMGMGEGNVFRLPLTQNELADALGLTPVTVNRVLQDFRLEGLVERERSRMVIRDWAGLARIGEFDPTYLHMRSSVDFGVDR